MTRKQNQLTVIERGGYTHRRWLRDDEPGSLDTLADMRRIVRADVGLDGHHMDRGLWQHAHAILDAAGVPGHDWRDEIQALLNYTRRITYRRDPAGGGDDIADARIPIKDGFGDCDDLAVVLATLLALCGYESEFKATKYDRNYNGYQHVYVMAYTPDGKLALDPTHPSAPAGWEAPGIIEAATVPLFETETESAKVSGFFDFLRGITGPVTQGLTPILGARTATEIGAALAFSSQVGSALSAAHASKRQQETARDVLKNQALAALDAMRNAVAAGQLDGATARAQSEAVIAAYYNTMAQFSNRAVRESAENFRPYYNERLQLLDQVIAAANAPLTEAVDDPASVAIPAAIPVATIAPPVDSLWDRLKGEAQAQPLVAVIAVAGGFLLVKRLVSGG